MSLVLGADKELDYIAACKRQERWAQEVLYKEFYPIVLPICHRYATNKEDALDIMHEGFIKVFKHINKYKIGTSLNAWIKRIMINTAIDYYRKAIRRRTEDLDSAYHVHAGDPSVISQMSADEIIECLSDLSPSYRAIFNLYVIEGYAHKDIAVRLGITESTSRSNLVKARKKLKSLLMAKSESYARR